jgi:hypothetical protein
MHPHDDSVDNGNDYRTPASLYAPFFLPASAFVVRSPYATACPTDPPCLFPPSFSKAFKTFKKCDKAAEHPSEQCRIERSLIHDAASSEPK